MTWRPDRSQRGQPRPAHTYRGARKNAERGTRISLLLRTEGRDKLRALNAKANAPKAKHPLGVHARPHPLDDLTRVSQELGLE